MYITTPLVLINATNIIQETAASQRDVSEGACDILHYSGGVCCSDGWAVRPDVVEDIEDQIAGGVSMKLYSPEIYDFDEYYFRLEPYNNSRNKWFQEFWQERFKCYIDGDDRDPRYTRNCTGQWSLRVTRWSLGGHSVVTQWSAAVT